METRICQGLLQLQCLHVISYFKLKNETFLNWDNFFLSFKANRWLDIENKPESEKYISIEIEPSGEVESNVKRYEVHVKTSDETGAGTDSNIFMSLKGASGELANVELKTYVFDKNKNIFEQNQVDKFVLYTKDIGKVRKNKKLWSQMWLFV